MTHLKLAATAALAAMLIGGCTGAPASTPSPTSVLSSPAVTATPSLSVEDQKLEDSKARVVLLWKTLDGLLVDPGKSINELDTLASGDALSSLQIMLTTVRQRGQVQVGSTTIPTQSVVTQGDGWVVTSCIDRSGAKLTDKSGQPVTPAPEPRISHRSTLQTVGPNLEVTKDEVLGSC
jgi:hypothetical protein